MTVPIISSRTRATFVARLLGEMAIENDQIIEYMVETPGLVYCVKCGNKSFGCRYLGSSINRFKSRILIS